MGAPGCPPREIQSVVWPRMSNWIQHTPDRLILSNRLKDSASGSYLMTNVVPSVYLIPSSYKPLRTSCNYQLAVNETFPIRGGERIVYLRYWFYITYA